MHLDLLLLIIIHLMKHTSCICTHARTTGKIKKKKSCESTWAFFMGLHFISVIVSAAAADSSPPTQQQPAGLPLILSISSTACRCILLQSSPSPSPRHQLALTDERRWGATEHEDAVDEHPGAMVRGEGADMEEEEAPPTEKKSRLLPSISTAAPPSSSRIFLPSRLSTEVGQGGDRRRTPPSSWRIWKRVAPLQQYDGGSPLVST